MCIVCFFYLKYKYSYSFVMHISPVGGVTSIEDDYHQAVAANLVQELLYQNKRHRIHEEERVSTAGKSGTVRGSSGKQRRNSSSRDKVCVVFVESISSC